MNARLAAVKANVERLRVYRELMQARHAEASARAEKSKRRAELLQKSVDVFKEWLDDALKQNVGAISDLVTTGLQHIIHDQKLTFKIKQEMKYSRLSMRFVIEDESGAEGDPMASFGGGAVLTASLILRLAIMSRLGMGNLLLLDESMNALANKYVPAAASFMRQLSEQTGINILMVTHNEEFLNHAHVAYEGHKDGCLHLQRCKSVCAT